MEEKGKKCKDSKSFSPPLLSHERTKVSDGGFKAFVVLNYWVRGRRAGGGKGKISVLPFLENLAPQFSLEAVLRFSEEDLVEEE